MEALKTALLPAAVLIPTFLTLNYFGLMVMKFSFFSVGNAMGTPTRFWGCLLYTSPSPRDRG